MKTAILGGGASGLACAITLKTLCPDMDVTVYEKLPEAGKKLLATGNGRCNLTNAETDVSFYNGSSSILHTVLDGFDTQKCLRFFDTLGLLTAEEDGRIYPLSRNAASVRNVLLQELDRLEVPVVTDFAVRSVEKDGHEFVINGTVRADFAVMALGGKAASMHGTDGDGYRILKQLGVRYSPISPALVQLTTDGPTAGELKGVRVHGVISLFRESGALVAQETGEILFTDYGLSGIAAMQLSGDSAVLAKTEHPYVTLDLCPQLSADELKLYLEDRADRCNNQPRTALLTGLLNDRVAEAVIKEAGTAPAALADTIKAFRFPVTGTKGFKDAQVTRGGVPGDELNEHSLESRRIPGLFFTGELLDADGLCGGYNLHFAWGSGIYAAKEIAQHASNP